MATELAKAYVQIIPSAKGIQGSISNVIGGEADSAGKSAGGKIVGAIKGAIATAAIGKALGAALTEGAALEQSLGGIETLFKDSADKVKQNAAEAYRTAGMSANQYMELTTSFAASLLQSLGGDTQKAAEISDMAMTDMSDNANKMGTDMERITDAYQGFAKQNYTMLDNLKLGYGGTKEEMQRLLADAEKITGVKYDISNLSDVYSAIHVIQGELDITGTTAKEAASTLSGSFASMQAAFKNVLGQLTLGQDIGPALSALAETVTTFLVGNLLPAVWNILSALPGALLTFVQSLGSELIEAVSGIFAQMGTNSGPQLLTMVYNMLTQLGNAIMTNAPLLFQSANTMIDQLKLGIQTQLPVLLQQGVDMLTNIVNGILSGLPTLITGAMSVVTNFSATILSALPTIWEKGKELILNLVNGIINNLPSIISSAATAVLNFVSTIGQNLPSVLQSGITLLGELAAGLIKAIPNLVAKIPEIITSIIDTFMETDWASIGGDIIAGIANGLANAGEALWDAVKGVLGSFKDKVLGFFGIESPSKWGMYVGDMITAGFANGVIDNRNRIATAVDEMTATAAGPLNSDMTYLMSGRNMTISTGDEYAVKNRLDAILDAIERSADREQVIVLRIGNRDAARWIRENGGVFA